MLATENEATLCKSLAINDHSKGSMLVSIPMTSVLVLLVCPNSGFEVPGEIAQGTWVYRLLCVAVATSFYAAAGGVGIGLDVSWPHNCIVWNITCLTLV